MTDDKQWMEDVVALPEDRDGWHFNVSPDGFIPTAEGPIHVESVPGIIKEWAELKRRLPRDMDDMRTFVPDRYEEYATWNPHGDVISSCRIEERGGARLRACVESRGKGGNASGQQGRRIPRLQSVAGRHYSGRVAVTETPCCANSGAMQ